MATYFKEKEFNDEGHGFMVDYFSLGVLFYELLVGLPPFYDPNKMAMFNKIMYSEPKFPNNFP